jgi:hypothetical protein
LQLRSAHRWVPPFEADGTLVWYKRCRTESEVANADEDQVRSDQIKTEKKIIRREAKIVYG